MAIYSSDTHDQLFKDTYIKIISPFYVKGYCIKYHHGEGVKFTLIKEQMNGVVQICAGNVAY